MTEKGTAVQSIFVILAMLISALGVANAAEKPSDLCNSINNPQIIQELIRNGAPVKNATCLANDSLLSFALRNKAYDTAQLLIEHGTDINGSIGQMIKRPILHAMISDGNLDAVRWLLEHGADTNITAGMNTPTLAWSAGPRGTLEMMKLLLQYGTKLQPEQASATFQTACINGKLDILDFLLSQNITPDYNACYISITHQQTSDKRTIRWLTERSKISNLPVKGETLLHIAVDNNNVEIVKLLLEAGADANVKGYRNRPPLDGAIRNARIEVKHTYHPEIIHLLMKHGANLDVRYEARKGTLLHTLAKTPIIDPSPNYNYWEKQNQTRLEATELLISLGASVKGIDADGNTPLHLAAETDNILVAKALLSHGASLEARNTAGKTPLQIALASRKKSLGLKKHADEITTRWLNMVEMLIDAEKAAGISQDWELLKAETSVTNATQNRQAILNLLNAMESQKTAQVATALKSANDECKKQRSSSAQADVAWAKEQHAKLIGNWAIDPDATKAALKTASLSPAQKKLFAMQSAFIVGLNATFFTDDGLAIGPLKTVSKATFEVLPQPTKQLKYYAPTSKESVVVSVDTASAHLTFAFATDDSTSNDIFRFFVWRRSDNKTVEQLKKDITELWVPWIKEVGEMLNL